MEPTNHPIPEEQIRTAQVLGTRAIQRLATAKVAIFGIGGVGGHIAEALARAGVGHMALIDRDTVSLSNINRQAVALHSTVGLPKVEVMAKRILDINPSCLVETYEMFYLPETAATFDLSRFDFIADAVDTVAAKIELAVRCHEANVPLISAMGAGNKLYPERFRVADLFQTDTDPLARIMRKELKSRGIKHLTVVYSDEIPIPTQTGTNGERLAPGSLSFVPGAMGLIMAGEMIRRLIENN